MESVAVSNRDCVGVQSTAHVHVLKKEGFRCRRVKDLTSPPYVSFYSSPATKCPSVCNIPWYEYAA